MADVVFFLGAGASKPAGGPLVQEFVAAIEQVIPEARLSPEDISALETVRAAARRTPGLDESNLEHLLSAALTTGQDRDSDRTLLWHMGRIIDAALTSRIRFPLRNGRLSSPDASYSDLAGLIRDLRARGRDRIALITVNYDVSGDVAILESGLLPYYCLNPDRRASDREVDLAKLHGSLNWLGCAGDGCGYVNAKHHINELLSREGQEWPDSARHRLEFPRTSQAERCESCLRPLQSPLIVPPLADKADYVNDMRVVWEHARQHLRGASLVAVAGYSCSETDALVNELLTESGSGTSGFTALIANPSEADRERARRLLANASRFRSVRDLGEAVAAVRGQFSIGSPSSGCRPPPSA